MAEFFSNFQILIPRLLFPLQALLALLSLGWKRGRIYFLEEKEMNFLRFYPTNIGSIFLKVPLGYKILRTPFKCQSI
jgi:hypothetical protein